MNFAIQGSRDSELRLYIYAKMLKETYPETLKYLPKSVTDCEVVQLVDNEMELELTNERANTINAYVRRRILGLDARPITELEFRLVEQVCAKFADTEYLRTFALANYRRDLFHRAIELLETNDPKKPFDYRLLSMCHYRLGNKELGDEFRKKSRTRDNSAEAVDDDNEEAKLMKKELNQVRDTYR